MTEFADLPNALSAGSSTFPGASSLAMSTPSVVLPTFPVIFAPYRGSTIVRVWMRFIGPRMSKISCPSRKNGRSSEKNSGNRRFTSICGKSGLQVKSSVRFDVRPYLKLTPPSGCRSSVKPPVVVSRLPAWIAVTVGWISRLRLVDRPRNPSSSPICGRNPETSRETGAQTTVSSLPRIDRAI